MSTRYIIRFGSDYPGAGSASGTLIRAPWQTANNGAGPYPRVVGGVTLGSLIDVGLNVQSAAGWSSGDDEALRGRWRMANADTPRSYRIDLPDGAGQYRLWIGCAAGPFQRGRWRINDGVGGANRLDVSWSGVTVFGADEPGSLDQWARLTDTGTVTNAGAIDADAFDPAIAPRLMQFDSGAMEFINGGNGPNLNSDVSFIAFEKVVAGPTVSAISPTSGRATGTVVDITVTDSTGATGAAINGVPLTGFTIVNATTVRGTTNGATTGAVSVTNAEGTGTGPTFTVVPVANLIRFQGGGAAPWAPADGPTVGVPYTFTLEAWNTTSSARDTLIAGNVTLGIDFVAGDNVVVQSGPTSVAWAIGLAAFSNVVFAEQSGPPIIPMEPMVQRIPVFTTQPVVATQGAGTAFSTQPVVTVRDSAGATITGFTGLVVLRARGGLLLQGNTIVNAVAGVATFSGVVPYLTEGGQFRGRIEAVLATGEAGQSDVISVLAPGQPVYQRTRTLTVRDYHTAGAFQIAGTVTGGPVFFEGTLDGANWAALAATPLAGGTAVTQATTAGIWRFVPDGLSGVRLRLDAAVSTEPVLIINLEAE